MVSQTGIGIAAACAVDMVDFVAAMSRAASSVSIVTTKGGGKQSGVTVSSMTSVSAEPPAILVCIRKASGVAADVLRNKVFCVSMLRDDQSAVADVFAGRGAADIDRFCSGDWEELATGCPALVGAVTAFDCTLADCHAFGSHFLFIGQVVGVRSVDAASTLVYHDRKYCKVAPATPMIGHELARCAAAV